MRDRERQREIERDRVSYSSLNRAQEHSLICRRAVYDLCVSNKKLSDNIFKCQAESNAAHNALSSFHTLYSTAIPVYISHILPVMYFYKIEILYYRINTYALFITSKKCLLFTILI